MAITSAIWNIHWLTTIQHTGITPVQWQTVTTYPSNVQKITGHTNTLTPSVLEINKINIFFRPGRSHVRNWQKLVLTLKILVLLERILDLYTSKQNEKYPHTSLFNYQRMSVYLVYCHYSPFCLILASFVDIDRQNL